MDNHKWDIALSTGVYDVFWCKHCGSLRIKKSGQNSTTKYYKVDSEYDRATCPPCYRSDFEGCIPVHKEALLEVIGTLRNERLQYSANLLQFGNVLERDCLLCGARVKTSELTEHKC